MAREDDKNKEQVIAQFKVLITKNRQLTAYKARSYSNGYELDFTANTQNSEAIFVFQVDSTEFNTNVDVNSNGEIEGTSDLTVNTAVSKCILQK